MHNTLAKEMKAPTTADCAQHLRRLIQVLGWRRSLPHLCSGTLGSSSLHTPQRSSDDTDRSCQRSRKADQGPATMPGEQGQRVRREVTGQRLVHLILVSDSCVCVLVCERGRGGLEEKHSRQTRQVLQCNCITASVPRRGKDVYFFCSSAALMTLRPLTASLNYRGCMRKTSLSSAFP